MSINVKMAARALAQLSVLKFFPADDTARAEIVAIACRMASDNNQIDWLARRCVDLWNEWEGPREMRAVFCSKYKPADGIDVVSALPQFVDGIPSESEDRNQQLIGGAGEQKRLPPGPIAELIREVTRDRDKLNEIQESIERGQFISKAPALDQSEIERIRQEQESRRDPEAAEKLARELGLL